MTDRGWRRAVEPVDEARRGLGNERTALAWTRSALALAASAGLILHLGSEHSAYAVAYPLGGCVLVIAAAAWGYGNMVYADRRREVSNHVAEPTALRIVAMLTALLAMASFVSALLS